MSKSVDERIVQMRFENKQFEDGVQTSIKSLDNLKKGLDLKGASKGLSDLQKAGKSFTLASIATSVDAIANKFTTLGIVGITTLQNLTNSAINAGKRMISSLTIDPIKMGFGEYETKMNAIQTILTNTASKGTTLKDVNEALNELNAYADQTIYNFAEMTRNIGTFTAAGIDLKTSATSIKGIANLAAGSGSSAQQASTAMYQLSQALAAGKVSLMDWNSVVNAGMGGELFQKALEKTAKELGHGRNMAVSFRESLQDGWITTDVLTKTLQKFANDPSLIKAATQVKTFTQLIDTMRESVQSGWAQTWETMLGNKDEAAALFTGINDAFGSVVGASAAARNEMLLFWKDNGGKAAIIEAISNSLIGLSQILKPIEDAFREIFPPMTGQRLVELSKGLRDLTSHFKIGDKTAANLKMTFKGLFAVLDIGVKAFKLVTHAVSLLVQALLPGSNSLLSVTASIGSFLVYLDESIEKSGMMTKAFESMGTVFGFLKNVISKGLSALGPILGGVNDILISLGGAFREFFMGTTVYAEGLSGTNEVFSTVESGSNKVKTSLEKVHEVFQKIWTATTNVAKAIKNSLSPVLDFVKKKLDGLTLQDVGAFMTGGGLLLFAKALLKGLSSVDSIVSNFSKVVEQVGDTLKAFQLKVKSQALLNIAIAVGILAASLIALSYVKMEDIAKSLGMLTLMLTALVGAMVIISKTTKEMKGLSGLFGGIGTGAVLISLSAGILLLATAAKMLASVDANNLQQGIKGIAVLLTSLMLFINLTRGANLKASAGGLIGFSLGILALTGALAILGRMDMNQLILGGEALGALLGAIMLFINLTRGADLATSAGGLIGFSLGIMTLTGSLAILARMDMNQLIKGGEALGVMLGAIMLFINLTRGADLATSAGGLIGFSLGILALVGALAILGKMNFNQLIQGGEALGAILGGIMLFVNLTRGGDLAASSSGIIGFSVGITILTGALAILGKMDPNKLVQSVAAISALILAIGLFVDVTRGGDLAASSAGIIGFSMGLIALSGAVAILASIDANKIVQGVTAITVLMTSIALFVKLTKEGDLKKSAEGIIKFSAGLMILAGTVAILSALNTDKIMVASVAISTLMTTIALFVKFTKGGDLASSALGLIAFSVGIGALSASLVYLSGLDTNKIIASGSAITVLLLSIIAFVKMTTAGDLVISAAGLAIFSGAILVLTNVLITLGSTDLMTLAKGVGAIAATFVVIGLTATILAPLTPVILALSAAIALFGVGCLAVGAGMTAFATGITMLAKTGSAGASALTNVVKSIVALIPMMLTTLAKGIVDFIVTIGNSAPKIADAFMKVLNSIINTVKTSIPNIMNCIQTLVNSMLNTLVNTIPKMVDSGMKLILGILKGIADNIQKVIVAGVEVITGFLKGVATKLPDIIDTAFKVIISFINGLADAIRGNNNAIFEACGNLIDAMVDSLTNLIPNLVTVGKNIVIGLINGVKSMISEASKATAGLGTSVIESAKKVLGIHSPSRLFAEIGENIVKGMSGGIDDNAKKAVDSSENMSKKVTKASTKVVKKSNESAKEAFDKAVEWIDERKYYNQLSLAQELAAWEDLQKKYKEGSEERKRIDREIYRVHQEITNKIAEDEKAAFNTSVDLIEERKYYNNLNLSEELAAWQAIQAKYKEGTEERKRADREVYRVQQDIARANQEMTNKALELQENFTTKRKALEDDYYSKVKEVNDKLAQDIQNVTKEYEDAVNSRAQSLYNAYSLFDKVEVKDPISADQLTKNLKDQVTQFESWQKNISDLAKKGIDEGLLKELRDMGPQASAEIAALNTMSGTKLTEYVTLWKKKHEDAKTQAVGELEGMRLDTIKKIGELTASSKVELDKYLTMFSEQMADLTWQTAIGLQTLKTNWSTEIGTLKDDTEKKFNTLVDSVEKIIISEDWTGLGRNITAGMSAGIQQGSAALASQAAATAKAALDASKKALGIHSPSREFAKVGMYSALGMVDGLKTYTSKVVTSATEMGNTAVSALQGTIAKISDVINGNMDMTPTIRPVLDLSDVEAGASNINSLFSQTKGINVSTIIGKVPKIGPDPVSETVQSPSAPSEGTNISFVQNNYSPKALSRLDIYRQTNRQISAMKGLVESV